MKVWTIAALAGALSLAGPGSAAKPPVDPLVGTWILDEATDTPEGGEAIHAFGKRPVGVFIFTADGYFSFSLMRDPPVPQSNSAHLYETVQPNWYFSYFGTYRHEAGKAQWTQHVLGGNIPSYIGKEMTRDFSVSGDTLRTWATFTADGKTFRAVRTLHRVKG